ncbi:MAG TPA: hemerythrin domain-containing protein [Actinomycetota bacterium]|nr:hemerythrin domain-containing protein [Actinomycetota bacterium]
MSTDAISILKQDHKEVEQLFRKFEQAGDRAHKSKRSLMDRIVRELSVHAAIEELIMYPAARETLDDDDPVLEALEEHHIVKWTLSELERMDPTHARFDAKAKVLFEMVRHHVEEEESELFPALRDKLGRTRLSEIGEALMQAKKAAPTRPHPRMPDQPPGNVLGGMAMAAGDRVIDLTRDIKEKVSGKR